MTKDSEIEAGSTANVEITVTEEMTASAFARSEGEDYPPVLATPMMIGEMERASASLIRPLLDAGQLSVGVTVEVSHTAPTPVGATVTSHARFVGREDALFWFEVWAEDDKGPIGKGRHARAIVDNEAIVKRAEKRRRAV